MSHAERPGDDETAKGVAVTVGVGVSVLSQYSSGGGQRWRSCRRRWKSVEDPVYRESYVIHDYGASVSYKISGDCVIDLSPAHIPDFRYDPDPLQKGIRTIRYVFQLSLASRLCFDDVGI